MKPFKEVIDGIRKAVMAHEVREDLAQMGEYVEQFANTAGENIQKAIDPTLSLSGKAADAKATGDAIGELKEDINNLNASLNIENPANGSLLIVKAYDESTPVISGLKIESNISYSFTFSIDEVLNIPVYFYLRKSDGESVTQSGIAQIAVGEKNVIVSKTYSENIENAYISAQCGNAGIGKTITASVEKTIKVPTKIEEFSRDITILKSASNRIDNNIKLNSFVSGMVELDFNTLSGSYIKNDGTIGKAEPAYCVSDMVKVNPGERYVVKACSGYKGIIVAFYDANKNYINRPLIGTEPSLSATAVENQLNMIEIEIPYDVAYIRISYNTTVFDGKIYRITDVIFVENTKNIEAETTQEISTIFSSSKRIIPPDDPKGEAGEIADTSNATDVVSNFIPVNGGDLYTITATAGYGNLVYAFYDENKKYIDGHASVKGYSSRNCILCNTIIRIPGFGKHYLVVSSNTAVIDAKIGKILSIKAKETIDSFLNLPAKFLSISYSSIWIAPINTLETYISAWKLGFNCCKGDVQPTSDGKLIMCHDDGFTFDSDGRITSYNPDNSTPIHFLTYSDCMEKEYSLSVSSNTNDHYSKVADIDGYLTVCREYGMLALITIRNEYLDIVVPEVLSKIKKYKLESKTILNTYDDKTIAKIRELDANILVSKILANDTPVKVENIDGAVNIGNCIVTAVLNYSDSADRIDYLVPDDITRYAAEKNVGIIIAGINTRDKTNKCISKGILGAQIIKPVVQYDMRQYPFTVAIRDGNVSVMTFLDGDVETFSATVSVTDNTISISDFKESGSHRGFSDLIMPMWMNTFPYRIFAVSKNGKKVTAQWKDNALIIEVEDINVNDTIIGFIEV